MQQAILALHGRRHPVTLPDGVSLTLAPAPGTGHLRYELVAGGARRGWLAPKFPGASWWTLGTGDGFDVDCASAQMAIDILLDRLGLSGRVDRVVARAHRPIPGLRVVALGDA